MVIWCDVRSIEIEVCKMLARVLETLIEKIGRCARGGCVAEIKGVVARIGGCMMVRVLWLLVVQAGDMLMRLRELRTGCGFKVAVAVQGWRIRGVDGLEGLEG